MAAESGAVASKHALMLLTQAEKSEASPSRYPDLSSALTSSLGSYALFKYSILRPERAKKKKQKRAKTMQREILSALIKLV